MKGLSFTLPDRLLFLMPRVFIVTEDLKRPIKLALQPWTGNVFEIRSARLLGLTAQAVLHESLPRMLNCIVPRTILNTVQVNFGAIFDSISPDFNFCYKALALEDTI